MFQNQPAIRTVNTSPYFLWCSFRNSCVSFPNSRAFPTKGIHPFTRGGSPSRLQTPQNLQNHNHQRLSQIQVFLCRYLLQNKSIWELYFETLGTVHFLFSVDPLTESSCIKVLIRPHEQSMVAPWWKQKKSMLGNVKSPESAESLVATVIYTFIWWCVHFDQGSPNFAAHQTSCIWAGTSSRAVSVRGRTFSKNQTSTV